MPKVTRHEEQPLTRADGSPLKIDDLLAVHVQFAGCSYHNDFYKVVKLTGKFIVAVKMSKESTTRRNDEYVHERVVKPVEPIIGAHFRFGKDGSLKVGRRSWLFAYPYNEGQTYLDVTDWGD